jgi:IS30 family transposase
VSAERRDIEYFLNQGCKKSEIARKLKRAYSSVWDEINRNPVNGKYEAKKADHKAYQRRRDSKYQGMKVVAGNDLRGKVEEWLRQGQSPESIAGRIEEQERDLSRVSKNSIRRFLESPYGRQIEYLRNKRKKIKRRFKQPRIKNRKSIHERPKSIEKRCRVGDAEGDFICSGKSGKGIIFVVVDRRLRRKFLEKILRPNFDNVKRAGLRVKKRYPEWKSMTTDNDLLFEKHEVLEIVWGITIYFCDKHSPWQKGSIENANKEIRQDIPKGSDISKVSRYRIKKLEEKLNNKFMKCLRYRTPNEALNLYRKRKNALSRE